MPGEWRPHVWSPEALCYNRMSSVDGDSSNRTYIVVPVVTITYSCRIANMAASSSKIVLSSFLLRSISIIPSMFVVHAHTFRPDKACIHVLRPLESLWWGEKEAAWAARLHVLHRTASWDNGILRSSCSGFDVIQHAAACTSSEIALMTGVNRYYLQKVKVLTG